MSMVIIKRHPNQPKTEQKMQSVTIEDLPIVPLTGETLAANFGKLPVKISAGDGKDGPAVFILTPHMDAPAGVGFVHTLSQDDAVQLGAAIYASMTTAGQLQFVAALGRQEN